MQTALPPGTVNALLASDLVTPPTRAALQGRLDHAHAGGAPRFFDADTFAVLRAVCARLLPIAATPGGPPAGEIAALVERLTAHAERTMRAIWEAAGGRDLWSFQRFAHVIGTCRMGADPAENVVNADGRCFDVPGLFICDNSVFPSALSVNPALTILALSLRTADRFLQSQKTG